MKKIEKEKKEKATQREKREQPRRSRLEKKKIAKRERERERELCVQSVVVFERDNLCVREQRKIREIFSLTA